MLSTPKTTQNNNFFPPVITDVQTMIPDFVEKYRTIWWSKGSELPHFDRTFSDSQQKDFERKLDHETSNLINATKKRSQNLENMDLFQQNARLTITRLAEEMFLLEPSEFQIVEEAGLYNAAIDFFRMAREFDPDIPFSDIYQAGRNAITANLIQLLLGLPVQITPSLFAYSMLYPYTDNYLDDAGISFEEKKSFNKRFRRRLMGEMVETANKNEKNINSLIVMIESEWDRNVYPLVYQSLLAIHSAQCKSLDLVSSDLSPYEKDILGITFEKGGTSVLADGYLAAGTLTYDQAYTLFGFGAFTQLMDDMEDISTDLKEQRASLFSISAPYWKLDNLCNRFFHFGRETINHLNMFDGKYVPELTGLITKCIDPVLLGSLSNSLVYFPRPFIQELESHLPFRFKAIAKLRGKINQHRAQILQLVEASLNM
jgi:hypothetical protein